MKALSDVTQRMLDEIEEQAIKAALEEIISLQGDALKQVQQTIEQTKTLRDEAAEAQADAKRMMREAVDMFTNLRDLEKELRAGNASAISSAQQASTQVAVLQTQVAAERSMRERSDAEARSLRKRCEQMESAMMREEQAEAKEEAREAVLPQQPIEVVIPTLKVVRSAEGRILRLEPQ